MKRIVYSGEIWQAGGCHPDLWELLLQTDCLIELSSGKTPYAVVLGVPHHAAPGVQRIAERWTYPQTGVSGRPADESAGLCGLAVFSALRERHIPCKLVIAAHPLDHDPNKTPHSAYWEHIFAPPAPNLLLEIHGAAQHRRHALELSAGQNTITDPLSAGKALTYFLGGTPPLAVQRQPGTNSAVVFQEADQTEGLLQNPALGTRSLSEAAQRGIPALHLETKSTFRQPDPRFPQSPRPTPEGQRLAQALADAIQLLVQTNEIHIPPPEGHTNPFSGVFLTRPAEEYEASYLNAVAEADLREKAENPDLWIETPEEFARLVKANRPLVLDGLPGDPPEEYLWLIDHGEWIGRILLLHWLNEYRRQTDGQVDYWIRPSKRGQGYGHLILKLGLERFRQLGLESILLSCRSDNLPSRKIIEANGGVFEREIETPDVFGLFRPRRRYWIHL